MKSQRVRELKKALKVSASDKRKILRGDEVWIPVPGYKKFYEISSHGRFKRLKRTRVYTRVMHGKEIEIKSTTKESIDTPSTKKRYIELTLTNSTGTPSFFYLHRLMIISFFGMKTNYKLVTDHLDANKHNNNIANLQIVTARYNIVKAIRQSGKKHSSKFMGVYYNKRDNKYIASISIDNKKVHIGTFEDEIDAAHAYQSKVMSLNIKI